MWDEEGGHLVVDGGVLSNFPLKYLLNDTKHSTPEGVLGPLPDDRKTRVLGLLLDEGKDAPPGAASRKKKRFAERLTAYRSVSRLVDTMTSAWDKEAIEEYKAERYICRIGVKGVDTLDFDMNKDQLKALVESGRQGMRDYLQSLECSP
jgi:predicted acylesterase/phospholipase RssA